VGTFGKSAFDKAEEIVDLPDCTVLRERIREEGEPIQSVAKCGTDGAVRPQLRELDHPWARQKWRRDTDGPVEEFLLLWTLAHKRDAGLRRAKHSPASIGHCQEVAVFDQRGLCQPTCCIRDNDELVIPDLRRSAANCSPNSETSTRVFVGPRDAHLRMGWALYGGDVICAINAVDNHFYAIASPQSPATQAAGCWSVQLNCCKSSDLHKCSYVWVGTELGSSQW
jgi:hypothetical protein